MTTPATIAEGASGPTVRWAQYLLVRRTLSCTQIDGSFGPATGTALIGNGPQTILAIQSIQTQAGLTADGIVGLQTWAIPVRATGETVADLCGVPAPGVG